MVTPTGSAVSVTPTQSIQFRHGRSMSIQSSESGHGLKDTLYPPGRDGKDSRSMSNASATFGPRGSSLASNVPPPGSFSSDFKTPTLPRPGTPRSDLGSFTTGDGHRAENIITSEQRQSDLRDKINKEIKIKIGSENLLEALISKNAKQTKDQRLKVESELSSSNRKLLELKSQLENEIDRANRPATPSRARASSRFQGSPLKLPSTDEGAPPQETRDGDLETESPTYVLGEILQALESEGMQPDYYVERANNLVELFKRHPALKYDLAWPIFGLRVQTMLLSESKEVIAAGYRVTRHAIADRRSLRIIRRLNTDSLVIVSLVKDSKASLEREQALKFVRAFLEVKDGVRELSNAVIRTIVSVAEHHDDRLRSMSILTISEILIREPSMVVMAGGIALLTDSLVSGHYQGFEGLAIPFLHLFDTPRQRTYFRSGHELDSMFTSFTDSVIVHGNEEKLKSSARLIAAIFKTWPGVFALSARKFSPVRSLLLSLAYPVSFAKDLILDLLFDILHIKPPSWASSYLAGRRLTTYGRVANLRAESLDHSVKSDLEEESHQLSLIDHFTTLLLAIFLHCGLIKAISDLIEETLDSALKRKATLFLGEVLKLANYSLPVSISAGYHVLPHMITSAVQAQLASISILTETINQADRVNRTLQRSSLASKGAQRASGRSQELGKPTRQSDVAKPKLDIDIDELQFRSLLLQTQVLATADYLKWKWDLIHDLIEGPLLNPKRLEEAIKATKFLKRLMGFYRPFKYRFSDVRNTKPNQRYVRTGCALVRTLLQNPEGIVYLSECKLLQQLAECLAQFDRVNGLTSVTPFFSPYRISETLAGGYFALLGALSCGPKGLLMLERWRVINMFYNIVNLEGRDDLVQALLGNMDFSLESHLRVMLSKALTACPKNIRIYSTKLLSKYATKFIPEGDDKTQNLGQWDWAIRLLVTQLYDPEVEVCEVAVQILEEACNQTSHLEYVVRCRPALDHLGEIGAPLLLRFLSTSLGYQYLQGLDYITQEMDDWFLGRNDSYVTLIEASLSRAFSVQTGRARSSSQEQARTEDLETIPPHFYRELTRTAEGCRLLRESGHFHDFVAIIQASWSCEDQETMRKVKGCMWAVGNVGSMEFGAPFLEETDAVALIVKIAEYSGVTTMRGTAFFVLGLISRSIHGMEILLENGWDTRTDSLGRSLGYCLPVQVERLFSIELHEGPKPGEPGRHASMERKQFTSDTDPVIARILKVVVNLGNPILTNKAVGQLNALKAEAPEKFNSVQCFIQVMAILESHDVRLPLRRLVIDLFDTSVMRRLVLDDEGEEG